MSAPQVGMTFCLAQFRRRINDPGTSGIEKFTDSLLQGMISDAVNEVEQEWTRGYYIDPTTNDFNMPITPMDSALFSLRANIIFASAMKEDSDRNNLNFSKTRLHIDNVQQSKDHYMQLERLQSEYTRMMWNMYYRKVPGVLIQGGF